MGYVVRHVDGREGFLKALDYSAALRHPNQAALLHHMTRAYMAERDLLYRCEGMSRIATPLADGVADLGQVFGILSHVDYIIFERAASDVRKYLDEETRFDLRWRFRTLHNVATGIQQLHGERIAHQDIKPSNVLDYGPNGSKITDLGRASREGADGPADELAVPGDRTYAPPELLYREIDPDWRRRRLGCDTYLLGSLAVYLFTRVAVTAAVLVRLTEDMHWMKWGDDYRSVLPHVRNAWGEVMDDFGLAVRAIPSRNGASLSEVTRQLTDPDPFLRGDPRVRARRGQQYDVQRYISFFNLMTNWAAFHRP